MKLGLVLVSHGSPSREWNDSMEEIANRVKDKLASHGNGPIFAITKLAHLEFASPTIADVCDYFEAEGCQRIVAIPIFISVSSHTHLDIPNALNIGFNLDHETDIRRYLGTIPVTLCPPLDHGSVLPKVISDCAKEMSAKPDTEAALILSHGDGCEHFWNHLHRRICAAVTNATGIENVQWVVVQTGRSDMSKARFKVKADEMLASGAEKLLLLSCFTGLSGSQFLDRLTPRGCIKDPRMIGDSGWASHPDVTAQLACYAEQAAVVVSGRKTEIVDLGEKSLPPYNPPFWLTRDM